MILERKDGTKYIKQETKIHANTSKHFGFVGYIAGLYINAVSAPVPIPAIHINK